MRKFIALLLAAILVVGMGACAPAVDNTKDTVETSDVSGVAGMNDANEETNVNDANGTSDTANNNDKSDTTGNNNNVDKNNKNDTTQTPAAEGKGLKIAICVAQYNAWNKQYEGVIKQKCAALGWTYEIFDAKQSIKEQTNQIRSVIAQGFDAMTVQAVDMAAVASVVEEAADAGVIVIDHYGFTGFQVSCEKIYQVLLDQNAASAQQSEALIEAIGRKGNVAIIAGMTGSEATLQFIGGFETALKKYSGTEIVAIEYCDRDSKRAQVSAENILTAYPNLTAFLVQDDGMAQGVWEAIEAAGKQKTCRIACQGDGAWAKGYAGAEKALITVTYSADAFADKAIEVIKKVATRQDVAHILYVDVKFQTK